MSATEDSPISDTVRCHACGTPLGLQVRFCRHCGAPTAGNPEDTNDLSRQPTNEAAGPEVPWPYAWQSPAYASPPLPPGYQPPPPPAHSEYHATSPSRADTGWPWPVIAAVLAAVVLAVSAILALVLATSGTGGSVHTATDLRITNPDEAGVEGQRTGSTSATGGLADGQSGQAPALGLTPYRGAKISAEVPTGWRMTENEATKSGYVESKWIDPAGSGDYTLIDASAATTGLTLEQDAVPVHSALRQESDYHEVAYRTGDLSGVNSWMWIFEISGDERIDYFFNRCATGFAVLGSSPTARFAELKATFRAVAQSVQAAC
jgi:hypothetical protein